MKISVEQWEQFSRNKITLWAKQECNRAIQEAQSKYFSEIGQGQTIEEIAKEALHMKGFIDGLKAALTLEPDFGEENEKRE